MPCVRLTISQVLRMTVSVFRPEKIHLQQAEVADGIHGVLRDERAVFVLLERQQIHQRLVADDHAGGVDARRCA